MNTKFNRYIYLFFVIVGTFSLLTQQYLEAASLLGLAIVFDPFDANQSIGEKPWWQKAIILGQAVLVISIVIPVIYKLWTNW